MPFLFEKLDVYQKAITFADKITTLTESFPKGNYYLADQLNRASLSISTNIAEGNGRFTTADKKHFFAISRGSIHECVPLLDLCKRKKLIGEENFSGFNSDLENLAKMISGLINGLAK